MGTRQRLRHRGILGCCRERKENFWPWRVCVALSVLGLVKGAACSVSGKLQGSCPGVAAGAQEGSKAVQRKDREHRQPARRSVDAGRGEIV